MSSLDSVSNSAANLSSSSLHIAPSGATAAAVHSSSAPISSVTGTTSASGSGSSAGVTHSNILSTNAVTNLHAPISATSTLPVSGKVGVAGSVSDGGAFTPRSSLGDQPGAFNLLTGASSIMGLREGQLAPQTPVGGGSSAESVFGNRGGVNSAAASLGQTAKAGDPQSAQQGPFQQADPDKAVPEIFAPQSDADAQGKPIGTEEDAKQQDAAAQQREKRAEVEAMANQQILKELKRRDAEVKAHEQAHAATGGQYAGTANFSYERGPDGQRYATDGEVQIDLATVTDDPLATINKMKQVYAAAMAPVNPSQADIQVAAEALQKMNEAKTLLTEERLEKAIKPEDLKPLLQAEALLKGFPELEEPEFGVSGEVDEKGNIARPQDEITNPVQESLKKIASAFNDSEENNPEVEQTESAVATATLEMQQENQALTLLLGGYYGDKPASTSSLILAV